MSGERRRPSIWTRRADGQDWPVVKTLTHATPRPEEKSPRPHTQCQWLASRVSPSYLLIPFLPPCLPPPPPRPPPPAAARPPPIHSKVSGTTSSSSRAGPNVYSRRVAGFVFFLSLYCLLLLGFGPLLSRGSVDRSIDCSDGIWVAACLRAPSSSSSFGSRLRPRFTPRASGLSDLDLAAWRA